MEYNSMVMDSTGAFLSTTPKGEMHKLCSGGEGYRLDTIISATYMVSLHRATSSKFEHTSYMWQNYIIGIIILMHLANK